MLWAESQEVCEMEQCIKDTLWDDAKIYCPHSNEITPIKGNYRRFQYVDQIIESGTRLKVTEEWIEVLCKDIESFPEISKCCLYIDTQKEGSRWFKIKDSIYQSHSKIRLTIKRCKEDFNPAKDRFTEDKDQPLGRNSRRRNPLATEFQS